MAIQAPNNIILFDLDGTLCHDDTAASLARREMMTEFGMHDAVWKDAEWKGDLSQIEEKDKYLHQLWDYDRSKFYKIFADAGYDYEAVNTTFFRHYDKIYLEHCTLIDGAIELLQELKDKGYIIGIISNKGQNYVDRQLEHLGISNIFDVVIGHTAGKDLKPSPDLINQAIKTLTDNKVIHPNNSNFSYVGNEKGDIHASLAASNPYYKIRPIFIGKANKDTNKIDLGKAKYYSDLHEVRTHFEQLPKPLTNTELEELYKDRALTNIIAYYYAINRPEMETAFLQLFFEDLASSLKARSGQLEKMEGFEGWFSDTQRFIDIGCGSGATYLEAGTQHIAVAQILRNLFPEMLPIPADYDLQAVLAANRLLYDEGIITKEAITKHGLVANGYNHAPFQV